MKKKLSTLVLSLVMCFGLVSTCFGAEAGVSEKEQQILDALNSGVTLENGTVVKIPEKYLTQATNYLASNDLTDAAVADVLSSIETTKADLKATGATSAADLQSKVTSDTTIAAKIAEDVNKAGSAAGVTLNVSFSSNGTSYALADSDGKIVAENTSVIKKTGVNYTATVAALIAIVAVAGGCVAVARKNGLFAHEA